MIPSVSNGLVMYKQRAEKLELWSRAMIVVYFQYFIPESATSLFCEISRQIFRVGLRAHTHIYTLSSTL